MKIDLTCPVELWQYAMPTEEDAECTFVMNNLSGKTVVSVQVALSCYDQEDELLFRQSERVQGLKAGAGERFSIVILPSEWKNVEGVDLVIEKVWFDDSTIWRKGNAPLAHYVSNALSGGRALDELRFVAGKDAMGYPQMQEQVWVCVCGRANAHESDHCCRCERRRDAVFASFTRENVAHVVAAHESKLAQAARKAREDNNIVQENQEKQRAARRRRRKTFFRAVSAVVIVAALAAAAVLWGLPTLQYKTAQDLLGDGHFDQARAAFSQIPDWRDSQTQMLECDYQQAQSLLAGGGLENLHRAREMFLTLAEYSDSAALAQQALYESGKLSLENADYEAALTAFEELGVYLDSTELLTETLYRKAGALFEAGSFEEARALFEELDGYQDAAERVHECTYQMGLNAMEAEQYEAAVQLLSGLGEYGDSLLLVQKASYALAEAAMEAERFEEAGEWYLKAGDYGDARAKANDSLYRLAQSIKEAGDFEKARELFLRIPDYLDSEGQAQTCLYAQAEALFAETDYAAAAQLFARIADYDDAQAKLDECYYQQALIAQENGDAEQAETLLAGTVDHKEASKLLKKVRYQLAEAEFEAGLYESALERYVLLESYSNAKTRAKQCRYALADAALTNKEYDTAIEAFAQLGSYKDSRDRLEEAQYQRALALRQQGDRDAALVALNQMGSSKRAREAIAEMTMEDAAQLEAAQQYEEALALYETLDKHAGAEERANACRYVLAQKQRENGDLFGAAAAFYALDAYQDAQAQADECYAAYYGEAAQNARSAMDEKDYASVVRWLKDFDLGALSKSYRDLEELFLEACYQQAEALYRAGNPYAALPYYQRAGEYRNAAEDKLGRRAYLILGEWNASDGQQAVFRTDGTCELQGETLCFRVSNFSLYTGPDAENMTLTHRINTLDEKGMSLYDLRNGQEIPCRFTREGAFALPVMELGDADE